MTAGLILAALALCALIFALRGDGAPSRAWLAIGALILLPAGFAPFAAISLITFEGVPTGAVPVLVAICVGMLVFVVLRLRRVVTLAILPALIAVTGLAVMVVVGALYAAPESGPTPRVRDHIYLMATWGAAILAAAAICVTGLLLSRRDQRVSIIALIVLGALVVANVFSS